MATRYTLEAERDRAMDLLNTLDRARRDAVALLSFVNRELDKLPEEPEVRDCLLDLL